MSVTIYHNPRCSKCRIGITALSEFTTDFTVVKYLEEKPFTVENLTNILQKLGMKPMELIRTNEKEYKEHIKGKDLPDKALIELMVEHPRLIQRPIVVKDDKAVLARPAEKLKELFI